jgi:hypothetical protein
MEDKPPDGDPDVVPFIQFLVGLPEPNLNYAPTLRVTTESGTVYEIDTRSEYLRRIPGTEEPDDPEVPLAARLRRDGTQIKLLRIIALEVGRRGVFDLAPLRPDAAFTRRTTTYVTSIEQFPTPDATQVTDRGSV